MGPYRMIQAFPWNELTHQSMQNNLRNMVDATGLVPLRITQERGGCSVAADSFLAKFTTFTCIAAL
jgi:hypothetical protein